MEVDEETRPVSCDQEQGSTEYGAPLQGVTYQPYQIQQQQGQHQQQQQQHQQHQQGHGQQHYQQQHPQQHFPQQHLQQKYPQQHPQQQYQQQHPQQLFRQQQQHQQHQQQCQLQEQQQQHNQLQQQSQQPPKLPFQQQLQHHPMQALQQQAHKIPVAWNPSQQFSSQFQNIHTPQGIGDSSNIQTTPQLSNLNPPQQGNQIPPNQIPSNFPQPNNIISPQQGMMYTQPHLRYVQLPHPYMTVPSQGPLYPVPGLMQTPQGGFTQYSGPTHQMYQQPFPRHGYPSHNQMIVGVPQGASQVTSLGGASIQTSQQRAPTPPNTDSPEEEDEEEEIQIQDEYKILIENASKETPKDCIENFIEAKTELTVEQIQTGRLKGTFLVTCREKPDPALLQSLFLKRKIDNSWLTVCQVMKTTCVRVISLAPNTTLDNIQFYFMNRRKSGGGNIKSVRLEEEDNSAVVNFYDPEIAERVCKKEHVIRETVVSAQLYYRCIEESETGSKVVHTPKRKDEANTQAFHGTSDSMSRPFPTSSKMNYPAVDQMTQALENTHLPSSVTVQGLESHILEFLSTSSLFRKEFSKYVADSCQGKDNFFRQKDGQILLMVDYQGAVEHLSRWHENIQRDVVGYVKNVLKLISITVEVPTEIFERVCAKLQPMIQYHSHFVQLHQGPGSSELTIYGEVTKVEIIKTETLKMIIADGNKQLREDFCTLKGNQSKYLILSKFQDKFPEVNIHVSMDDNKVTFKGPQDEVIIAKTECLRIFSVLASQDVVYKLAETMNLFDSSKTNGNIDKKMKDLSCIWECLPAARAVQIYAESESNVFKARDFLKVYILEAQILLDSSTEIVISKPEWREKKQEWLSTFQGQLEIVKENKHLYIICTSDVRDIILNDVNEYLKSRSLKTATLPLDSPRARFMRMFKMNIIHGMEKKYQVKIYVDEGIVCDEIRLSGYGKGCDDAEIQLKDMIGKISLKQHKITLPGIEQFFVKGKGRELLVAVEQNEKCVIEPKQEKSGSTRREICRWNVPGGGLLSIVHGDMRELKVDAIVNAANKDLQHHGGVAKAIVEKGGKSIQKESDSYIKKNGQLTDGDAVCLGAGSLPCEFVIHAVGPVWAGGVKEEVDVLKNTIRNIIDTAQSKKLTTIAIPAISTGIFGFPPETAISAIMESLLDHWQPDEDDVGLKEIYLCDVKKKTVDLFAEIGDKTFGKDKESDEDEDDSEDGSDGEVLKEEPNQGNRSGSESDENETEEEKDEDDPEDIESGIAVVKREITDMKADVIVCPAPVDLDLEASSISRSLLKVGGQEIQDECNDKYEEGMPLDELAETKGGNLKCKVIFYGLLKKWNNGSLKAEKALQDLVTKCLEQANDRKFKSIAFPALGTGRQGFPADTSASLMFQATRRFQEDNPTASLKLIFFVIHPGDRALYKAFKDTASTSYVPPPTRSASRCHRTFQGSPARSGGRSLRVGPVSVEICQGDITRESTDCVVNSCNESCDLGYSAISKALARAAGYQLQNECKAKRFDMVQKGYIITSGGKLKCKMVAHVKTQPSNWGWISALSKCLGALNSRNVSSVSVPALGTGGMKQSPDKMARVIYDAIEKFALRHQHPKLRHIRVVIFQEEMVDKFRSVFAGDKSRSSHSSSRSRGSGDHKDRRSHRKSKRPGKVESPDHDTVDMSNKHIDDSVTLCIYSDDKKAADSAKARLTRLCKEEFDHKTLSKTWSSFIEKLKNKELTALYRIADENGVALTRTSSGLALTGQLRLVSSAHEKIVEKLQGLQKLSQMQEEAKILAKLVEWAYVDEKGHSRLFTPGLNCLLEKARNDKQRNVDIVDLKGRKYTVDLEKMVEYPQDGGKPITIRRAEKGGSSGLGKYVAGEKDALAGSQTKYFTLQPERNFKGTAEDLHFRTAESQFYRLLSGQNTSYKVSKVDYVVNPQLVRQFRSAQEALKKSRSAKEAEPVLAFHGTNVSNISSICEKGFLKAGDPGFQMKSGNKFGNGVYFSEYPDYSMGYISGATKLLLCKVLLGKTYTISNFTSGGVAAGYDSHTSANGKELVIFDTSRILPCYIVHYTQGGQLSYM